MKRSIQSLIVAGLLMSPGAVMAGPVDDLDAAFGICGGDDSAACGQAMWALADLTGDGRLTTAELSRFLRIASEWTVGEQSGLQDAIGSLGVGDAEMSEDLSRAGAVAGAFISGPLGAKLLMDNFDYNGDGMLERSEVFADTDETLLIATIKTQMEKVPQYIAMAIMAAQQQAGNSGTASAEPLTPGFSMEFEAAANFEAETNFEAEVEMPAPEPEPVVELPSFKLRNIDNMVMSDNGLDVFVISGEIVNQSEETLAAPDAIVQGLDDQGQVLKTWNLTPGRSELGPGESARFIGRLEDAPFAATNWTVILADNE